MLKNEYFISYDGGTSGEIPVLVGICSDELSVAEIGEAIAPNGPLDREDRLADEKVTRPVFILEPMGEDGSTGRLIVKGESKQRWSWSDQSGFTWFAYNRSGAALTTGGSIRITATYYGKWLQ